MPSLSFDAAADKASTTSLPVPRGIVFRVDGAANRRKPSLAIATATAVLVDWSIVEVTGLPGWFEAIPKTETLPLGEFWDQVRALRALPGVDNVEPLFLIANPGSESAISFGQDQFGLWGWPYDDDTEREIARVGQDSAWHLDQLNVRNAWIEWRKLRQGAPGEGVLVGHPDTGYTDHPDLTGRLVPPGHSFLRDENGIEADDARDDLRFVDGVWKQQPGHGTATSSVIASTETDPAIGKFPEVFGVAPGAQILPLRVSRSVIHFDFGNVGRAILYAVDRGADVISMSLGGPGKSDFLRACIAKAHQAGVIVVSAAGNELPTVVFPAAFPEVVAVAATHAAKGPWRLSGLGREVDISAPGEGVWCARSKLKGNKIDFTSSQGTGTSFATACVAGLAALWLSYRGKREQIAQEYTGRLDLVPFAFQFLLAKTANSNFDFISHGRYGAGIADAEQLLLTPLPSQQDVERFKAVIDAHPVHSVSVFSGLLSGWLGITDRPVVSLTLDATSNSKGVDRTDAVKRAEKEQQHEEELLKRFLNSDFDTYKDELLARITADRQLLAGFQRWQPGQSLLPMFDRLLSDSDETISNGLRDRLTKQRVVEAQKENPFHRGKLDPPSAPLPAKPDDQDQSWATGPAQPPYRLLRAYAFDPSQETKLDTAPISQVTIPTRWEEVLPGPLGEYLEVIDVDPASGCVYAPVDLNHPYVLAQDGLTPSEGDPKFHQQMVYAVAMNTVHRFEMALGRPIFWAALRPWLRERPEEAREFTPEALDLAGEMNDEAEQKRSRLFNDRYVQRLRIYPHAVRDANAYYSPQKRGLLFGYFPGADDDTGTHFPGGMVFTCLSHDIVAHECTHALLDGMHPFFNEPSNKDVWAFHEAFADMMALFQHFTYPELLRHQIAHTRGDLETNNLLGQLAQQFGQAIGGHGALRDALGQFNPDTGKWERNVPDPRKLRNLSEPHARGSILVAAVFDAFLALYNDRVADLLRISTNGTGVLPAGQIHPDLVNRLASEAAQTAEDVLRVCIRAMDYVPPVDITFGEFLRAVITADYEIAPADVRKHRIAFIDAFRSWGIYPRDVSTLSDDSLRWRGPNVEAPFTKLTSIPGFSERDKQALFELASTLENWKPGNNRAAIFKSILQAQGTLHTMFERSAGNEVQRPLIPGIDLRKGAHFSVANLRPARRIGALGDFRTEMIVELVQSDRTHREEFDDDDPRRGGATMVIDLKTWEIRYIIYKRLYERLPTEPDGDDGKLANRFTRLKNENERLGLFGGSSSAWMAEDDGNLMNRLAQTYLSPQAEKARKRRAIQEEPFAFLHRTVE